MRDVDALLAKAVQAGVSVLTPGGKPVAIANGRAVLIEDPYGRPVELRQVAPLPQTNAPAESNVVGSRLSMTIADRDKTKYLYNDRFGFAFEATTPSFKADPLYQALTGAQGAGAPQRDDHARGAE